ncbi:hypothetical protein ASE86_03370 [Sphingomonas sp. Leaf33]|uniref:helix-turn-helix domain-containing protein n=1 Tax=Sphingomonas sp. Leaf33 TaxID=1736215 RepID=UPI0006FFA557|nr:helix-turn-helix transcriptional regulator [Sphingomonas sp. Leaf33]KQN25297.1 hypothetical protein ASE86_03370 [Sphingomonas sp. Leaf33]
MLVAALIEARKSSGVSQSALAARIGVPLQKIKRLERGVGLVETLVAVMTATNFRLTGLGSGDTLGAKLRASRLRRGWTVEKAASRAGISRTTLASLERGGGSVASLLRLLTVLAPKARRRAMERAH